MTLYQLNMGYITHLESHTLIVTCWSLDKDTNEVWYSQSGFPWRKATYLHKYHPGLCKSRRKQMSWNSCFLRECSEHLVFWQISIMSHLFRIKVFLLAYLDFSQRHWHNIWNRKMRIKTTCRGHIKIEYHVIILRMVTLEQNLRIIFG